MPPARLQAHVLTVDQPHIGIPTVMLAKAQAVSQPDVTAAELCESLSQGHEMMHCQQHVHICIASTILPSYF